MREALRPAPGVVSALPIAGGAGAAVGGPADGSASHSATSERASVAADEGLPRESPPADPSPVAVENDAELVEPALNGSGGTNPSGPDTRGRGRSRRLRWAAPLQRVFGIDALQCPRCGSTMRVLAAIEDPVVARKILACLGLPARAPPLAHAPREVPPENDRDFDQTPVEEEP